MLPNLKIVHLKNLVQHETSDPARITNLKKHFRATTVFTNPPLVAPFSRGRYLVLDGVNRISVATGLRFRDILVQVVDYRHPQVCLEKWNHIVCLANWQKWWQRVQAACPDQAVRLSTRRPRQAPGRRGYAAYIYSSSGQWYGIKSSRNELGYLTTINALVSTYRSRYPFFRTPQDKLSGNYCVSKTKILVVYPKFKKSDVVHFARQGLKIPCGISRHSIPQRALRVNLPFSVLRLSLSLKKKNRMLKAHINKLIINNRIRLYSEPIYLYDE